MPSAKGRKQLGVAPLPLVTAFTLACVLAVIAAGRAVAGEPPPDGLFSPRLAPGAAFPPEEAVIAAQLYHFAMLVLWLSLGSLVAGLLVGMVAQRRASLWAVLTVAAFLAVIPATGVGAAALNAAYLPMLAAGAVLVLAIAGVSGWIGEQVWRPVMRGPSAPDASG